MKSLLFIVAIVFASVYANAQMYFFLGSGYNLRTPFQSNSTIYNRKMLLIDSQSYYGGVVKYYSFGEGFNLKGGTGFLLTSNISIEGSVNFVNSKKINLENENGEIIYTYLAKSLQMSPAVKINTDIKKVSLFTKMGVIIALCRVYEHYEYWYGPAYHKYYGDIAFGISASVGCEYKINNSIRFFSEITLIGLTYTPTQYVAVDKLRFFNFKTTEYPEKLSDEQNIISIYFPNSQRKITYPFNSIGINLGIIYFFNKHNISEK